jgi:hypothetical protein
MSLIKDTNMTNDVEGKPKAVLSTTTATIVTPYSWKRPKGIGADQSA